MTTPIPYVPTEWDLAWARHLITHVTDGGVWGWPAIGAIYRFDHTAKTITLVEIEALERFDRAMHERTRPVFAAVGYKLLDEGTVERIFGDLTRLR